MAHAKRWFHPMASDVYYPHLALIRASNQHLGCASWLWSSWAVSSTQVVPTVWLGQAGCISLPAGLAAGMRNPLLRHPLISRQQQLFAGGPVLFSLLCSTSSCSFAPEPHWLWGCLACRCSCKCQRYRVGRVSSSETATPPQTVALAWVMLMPRMTLKSNILQGRACKSSLRACGISPSLPGLQAQRGWCTLCPYTSCIPALAHTYFLKPVSCLQPQKAKTIWD